ncbi:SO_0444 family Cu/Zn efflux transporter [Sulfuricurvum sp.]|uniref:SO_0444 family Cu/Zn efflux transporter n=1 Tax=Sulfuricurvum sp. TaxID=2025608 RepID=UPI0026342642|nr:SO_0444 family Cu/Zn efflux transporter [Sulfuricurvum sp.]MDD4883113.1 SO_0444 family Cu/Zn efflux transporter [Sulfuricurvum sp.]
MEALWESFWNLTAAMGIYIVIGLFIAGVLHELIPEGWIGRQLGAKDTKSVLKATLFGIPLPLCSCSVIPFAAELKRKGSSDGAVLAFLISTPITGIDSILATYGMFGWAFTLYRVVTSSIIAVVAGIVANLGSAPKVVATPKFSLSPNVPLQNTIQVKSPSESVKHPFSLKNALHYGYVSLLGGIATALFWGLVIGSFISMMIPESLGQYFSHNVWLGYLIAVAIAVPMYVCATASLPIAASLILAGVSPGAAFVFLSAGPATNTVTMGVVKSMLGTRALIIYLGSIIVGSVGFGMIFDTFFDPMSLKTMIMHHEENGWIENIGAGILLTLLAYNFILLRRNKKSSCGGGSCCA